MICVRWEIDTNDRIGKLSWKDGASLARNRKTTAYSESEGEKIAMAIHAWPDIKKKGDDVIRTKFLPYAIGEIGDRRLVYILEDPNFYSLLRIQRQTPVTWMVALPWKISWLWRVLSSPAGGVCRVLNYLE